MPNICECGHPETAHPEVFTQGNPSTGMPPWPAYRCSEQDCSCGHYEEDPSKVTDSERLVRIETMLTQVLRKLR